MNFRPVPLLARTLCLLAGTLGTLAVIGPARAAPPVLYNLGTLPGGSESRAGDLTPDGWIVAGYSNAPGFFSKAFKWTLSGGMQDLGVPSGYPWSAGAAINSTGTAVVGNGTNRLCRWTTSGGMVDLGLYGTSTYGLARGVSGDGSIVVGYSNNNGAGGFAALRWSGGPGFMLLPTLPGGLSTGNAAYGISPDGAQIVGESGHSGAGVKAVRWLAGGTIVQVLGAGTLTGGNVARGFDASADNTTIVGESLWSGSGFRAFRWTAAGGMVNLGVPSTHSSATDSTANDVNADGKAAVGRFYVGANNSRAMLWNTSVGTVDLQTYVNSLGLNTTGWTFIAAEGISSDGSAICGTGYFGAELRAFLIRNIPCPSTPIIVTDPVDFTTCTGGPPVALSFTAEAPGGGTDELEHRWQIEWPEGSGVMIDLIDGVFADPQGTLEFTVAGAGTPTLEISGMRAISSGPVRDIKFGGTTTNPCGAVSTALAVVSIVTPCNLADITDLGGSAEAPSCADHQLTVDDLIVFVNLYSDGAGCPGGPGTVGACSKADITGIGGPPEAPDSQLTVDDVIAFVNAFSEGC